ncbi:MAG: rRNA pseudouridine synthase [Chitinophagaceae bacterium]|nr:MAG: rRNA pseudouridine synthase [Chitinophagaceae bacterium]
MHRYFIINKPTNMVSQFVSTHEVGLLGDLNFDFPEGTHAIGRLDKDSEGLLLLTTDKRVTRLLFLAKTPHLRTYLVMVQNEVSAQTFQQLKEGIPIKIKEGETYIARPTNLEIIKDPLELYPYAADRREVYAHTWLLITLTEGKYRQVRKMVLAARHRCLRLVRLSISGLELNNLPPGDVKEMRQEEFYAALEIPLP